MDEQLEAWVATYTSRAEVHAPNSNENTSLLEASRQAEQFEQDFPEPARCCSSESLRSYGHRFINGIPLYLPIAKWLPEYDWKGNFIRDAFGGLTVGLILLPQSVAYASLAGVSPQLGLYSALFPTLFYALFGSVRTLSIGPTAMVSIIVGSLLSSVPPSNRDTVAILTCFFTGVAALLLGLFRFGFLDTIFSRPLVIGLINSLVVSVFAEELGPIIGIHPDENPDGSGVQSPIKKLIYVFNHISDAHWPSAVMGFSTVGFLVVFGILKKKFAHITALKVFPTILFVVLLSILISWGFDLEDYGFEMLGEIPSNIPAPSLPNFSITTTALAASSLIVSLIGFLESTLIAKTFADKYQYHVSSDRELTAFGICNLLGSLFSAYPVFGCFGRSIIVDVVGARTQMFSIFTFLVVLIALLFLTPLFKFIPICVMAATILFAALGLFNVKEAVFLWKIKAWVALISMGITFGLTVMFGGAFGLAFALGISILQILYRNSLPRISVIGHISSTNKFKDMRLFPDAKPLEGTFIVRISETLTHSNAAQIRRMMQKVEPSNLRVVVIDARNVLDIDPSAVRIVSDLIESYHKRGIQVRFVRLPAAKKKLFLRSELIEKVGATNFYSSVKEAVQGTGTTHSSYTDL
eukprot:TRINITY_DN6402_c0_g1_i1.p1 TRINITY_DN6402_c0_g1~~TRINITY_DN6402_c0_g1_i1.p1  ORF type:complete len:638 (+),score=295.23 TRINITY_DN6402_c0_g1_i1:74-1987(+)